MRRFAALLLMCALNFSPWTLAADESELVGYSPRSSQTEREWESKFRDIPDPANLREYMKRLSARPHHVGSPYDKDNAEWILARFKEWGLDAHIETFHVLFPTPKLRVLEMTEPTKFTAKLEEPALAVDPTSNQKSEQLPTYNAYSPDGDVTAPLVFVNYGLPEDYEKLDRLGVSVKGAIVIAKYYHSWRGVKPKVAAEHGAIGCLIYSEPEDDGYTRDVVFPQGPMRNSDGVQRGSVMDFASASPGDPLTPGVGATADAKRLSLKESKSLSKIPVLPISYGDAQPLLAALKGPMPPDERGRSPCLDQFLNGVARDVDEPETMMTVWQRQHLAQIANATPDDRTALRQRADLRLDALASGTDFTGFLDHLGNAIPHLGYRGED